MTVQGSWARVSVVSAGMALAFFVAGCDHAETGTTPTSAPPSLTAPSSTAPTANDPASAGRAALDAYRSMWRAYQAALEVPDPASADLAKYAAGEALKTLTTGVRSVKDQGLKGQGQIASSPRVVGAAPTDRPTTVEIEDCLDDSKSTLVRASPGPAFSDKPGGRRLTKATVQQQGDGTWKVTGFGAREVGTC